MHSLYTRLFFCMSLIFCPILGMVSAQNSSTDTCPASQFPDGGLGVVTPGDANNVRTEPSTSAALVGKLEPGDPFEVIANDFMASGFPRIEPVCADGYLWINIISQNISGWTVEISADGGGEPFVVPYEDPQPIEVGTMLEDGSIRVDEGGIAFTIPADLQIKRVLMQSQVGPLVYGRQCAFPNSINFLMEHEGEESLSYWEKSTLAVYPYALNESIYNYWDDNVGQELEDLLTNKPDLLTYGSLPWPPMCGAVALFGGAGHYLAFPNGDGLRFITEIAQDDVIFTDTTPFTYMYRGLTTDKNFLVKLDYLHVKIPANAIPAPVSRGDAGMYSAYIQQFEANLAAVPSDEFTPNLDVIDALIRTVTLGDAESVMRLIP